MAEENKFLEIVDLKKGYGSGETRQEVLRGMTFSVARGEICVLLGPSGSGKSTLLNIIGGIDSADAGFISIGGDKLEDMGEKALTQYRRKHLGYVFQLYNLIANLNVKENIEVGAYLSDAPLDIDELLHTLGLYEHRHKLPNQLSGGQQQRVAIARSLVNQPRVLLLDEPLGALDLKLRKEMQLELKRLQREMNITFVYVTHDQEEALTMSDTVVVMNKGNIQQIGSPQDIYNEPRNAFVAKFIGDSNIVDGIMEKDFLVSFGGQEFACVDRGFKPREPVQVVIRPEDVDIVPPSAGKLTGLVREVIFKGVHFEMHVDVEGKEWLIHSTQASQPGELIGMNIGPDEIHIMSREEV